MPSPPTASIADRASKFLAKVSHAPCTPLCVPSGGEKNLRPVRLSLQAGRSDASRKSFEWVPRAGSPAGPSRGWAGAEPGAGKIDLWLQVSVEIGKLC